MKIGNLNNALGTTPLDGDAKAPAKAAPAKTSATDGGSAQVALSSTASLIGSTPTDPTFDTAKVDRIASAIRDGKYEVRHEVIADKLISNAREVLGRLGGTH